MMQTQTMLPVQAKTVQPRKRNLQDFLLSKLRRTRMGATVFLVNGFQIRGVVTGSDSFSVFMLSDGRQEMIYKHAISTIMPAEPVKLS